MDWLYFITFLLGIGGNIIASAIWDRWKEGPEKEESWKTRLQSNNEAVRTQAFRECIANGLRWYVLANIIWVISGIAWSLDILEDIGLQGGIIGRIVMVVTAVMSLLFFGIALSWIRRYLKYATPP